MLFGVLPATYTPVLPIFDPRASALYLRSLGDEPLPPRLYSPEYAAMSTQARDRVSHIGRIEGLPEVFGREQAALRANRSSCDSACAF